MYLLIDVGNSNICYGFVEGKTLIKTFRMKTMLDRSSDEYYLMFNSFISNQSFDDVIISSVVPVITSALVKMFKNHYHKDVRILGPGIKTGIQIKADNPREVGSDLICDVAGAQTYCNESLIIDLGTATKYIYHKNSTFMGLSIAPGVSISMKALTSKAALLPEIELQIPKSILCNNTINCMQSGVIYGAVCQVDSMIDRIKEEINKPDLKIIATGGLASLIIPLCKNKIEIDPDLTLKGLLDIYLRNCK